MIGTYLQAIEAGDFPRLEKICHTPDGEVRDATRMGAFPYGTKVEYRVSAPRSGGWTGMFLILKRDDGQTREVPFSFESTSCGTDTYTLTLDTAAMCAGESDGLFFITPVFCRGRERRYAVSVNQVDFTLSETEGEAFSLTVYRADFHTPAWFRAGTMYHVFVDRFARGQGDVAHRADAELEPDWEHGIPRFAEHPGDPLPNNRFFGGNLWGVAEKLGYLREMGIKILYLSPIFRAYSNHKYDTGDYETVDGMFGGDTAFAHLLQEADRVGIRVILDGVFNHTGDDSKYFNRYGKYPTVGAYQSPDSPYRDWYRFEEYPNRYDAWWGISILPRLNHENVACRRYFTERDGIVARYVKAGIGGWRLDVVDELPDCFLDELRTSVKTQNSDAVIIGEVWENAAVKVSYGNRRRYLRGGQLDSVMNYPFRTAVLSFVKDRNAHALYNTLTELYASYPREVSDSLMNLLGTHDTERILTVLGATPAEFEGTNRELSTRRLSDEARARAKRLLVIASTLQFTVFGIPSVYYGDEAGVEGYHDPFCRMPYPWGRQDAELLAHYRRLGALRRKHVFDGGEFRILGHGADWIAYERVRGQERVIVCANMGSEVVTLPETVLCTEFLTGKRAKQLSAVPESVSVWIPVTRRSE